MRIVQIKDGVRFHSPAQAMAVASQVVEAAYASYSVSCVLTCGKEKHKPPSRHCYGGALDWRLNHADVQVAAAITDRVRKWLGDGFDVVAHGEGPSFHLHVEYDPKDSKGRSEVMQYGWRGRRPDWWRWGPVLMVAVLLLGCGVHAGTTPGGAKGVTFILGQAEMTAAGLKGGQISSPAALLLDGIFRGVATLAGAFFSPRPVAVPEPSASVPEPPPSAGLITVPPVGRPWLVEDEAPPGWEGWITWQDVDVGAVTTATRVPP